MITIIAIGKKHEPWIQPGIERYEKRLKKPFDVRWILLPHSTLEDQRARHNESEALLARLKKDEFVVLLDETGTSLSSVEFSRFVQRAFTTSKQIVLIIGGAYGVDNTIIERADMVLSLSKLVFPHQMVRLILAEQVYRAQEIAGSRPYHHT